MVSKTTATVLLIAVVVVIAVILFSSIEKGSGLVIGGEKIKVGYSIDGNKLSVVSITGSNNIPLPPGKIKIYSTDKNDPIGANILWRGNYKDQIQAGTTITNNINEGINLKMFYDDYPVIDAVVGPGSNILTNMSLNGFGGGTCAGCITDMNTIKFTG